MLRNLACVCCLIALVFAYPTQAQETKQAPQALGETNPAAALALELFKEAKQHFSDDEYPETIEVLDRMLAIQPGHSTAYAYRGIAHGEIGNHAQAIADYTRAIELSDSAGRRNLRGDAFFRAGRFKESVEDLEMSAKLDPEEAADLSYLPLSLYYLGEYERAAKQCVLMHNPAKENHHLVLIHYLCNLRLHGKDFATQKALTLPIDSKGDVPRLLQLFQEKISVDQMLDQSNNGYVHYFIGLWHDAHGRKEEAKSAIGNAHKFIQYRPTSEINEAINVHHWLMQNPRSSYPSRYRFKAIVYVIDISGSTIDTLPFILREMKASIHGLSERQIFAVLLYQNGRCIEAVAPGYKSATSNSKTRLFKWTDLEAGNIVPGGSGDPRTALKRAFKLNPDLIFLLSDNITGQGRNELNQKKLCADIVKMNADRRKINTIQFLHADTVEGFENGASTLKQIANDSGGRHKFVTAKDLNVEK